MTIHRNPVVAPPGLDTVVKSNPERYLHCLDFDEHGNDRGTRLCRDNLVKNSGKTFVSCPNKGNKNGKCQPGAFLYPRKLRPDGTTHHHQGLDISPYYHNKSGNFRYGADFKSDPDGVEKPRANIVSVVQGKVVNRPETTGGGGYGLKVVIKADDLLETWPRFASTTETPSETNSRNASLVRFSGAGPYSCGHALGYGR